jgi:ATP-dependent exoDNAse (exonuclease V) beta subunit
VFPVTSAVASGVEALGLLAAPADDEQAETLAEEIARLLATGATVRDRASGVRRAIRPGDIAVLFRTREGHHLFERALERRRVPYYVYKGLGFFDADEIKDVLAVLSYLARPESDLAAAAFLRSRVVRLSDEALTQLSPGLAAALTAPGAPDAVARLHPPDQARLEIARAALADWLPLVDCLPPSDVLDRVLTDSAYVVELAGPQARQALENLKKVRGLVRRMQNRGYATLGRVVDHFAELVAGGDESNAIVDAVDAVNLMTTHAAKGLEFPVVCLANMHRGSGGSPDPIRVMPARPEPTPAADPSGPPGEPAVAIGEHQDEADADADRREAEESKRLLYVAMTRARDRLYLAATLAPSGRFAPGKGGLGRTLPPAVAALVVAAAPDERIRVWHGASRVHRFKVLGPSGTLTVLADEAAAGRPRLDDFAPFEVGWPPRRAVAASTVEAAPESHREASLARPGTRQEHLDIGVLVHRAFAAGLGAVSDEGAVAAAMAGLVHPAERVRIDDLPGLLERSLAAFQRLRLQPAVAAVFGSTAAVAARRHEVPFSLRWDGSIVRGVIDCVAEFQDGSVDVLEFKTGRPRLDDAGQLAIYVEAASRLFPGRRVTGRLIHADPTADEPR